MSWTSTEGILIACAEFEPRPKPKRGREMDVNEENIVDGFGMNGGYVITWLESESTGREEVLNDLYVR